jgi:hypothetical protein
MAYETRKSFLEHPAITHSCRALGAGIVIGASAFTLIQLSAPVAAVGGILLLTGQVGLAVSALSGGMLALIAEIGALIDWLDENGNQFAERDIEAINALTDTLMEPIESILVRIDTNFVDIGNPKMDAKLLELRENVQAYKHAKNPVEKTVMRLKLFKDFAEFVIEAIKWFTPDTPRNRGGRRGSDDLSEVFDRWNRERPKNYPSNDRDPEKFRNIG